MNAPQTFAAAPDVSDSLQAATRFLQAHYCDDDLDADQVRRDVEHWERVAGDAARFPNANLDWIDQFTDAGLTYLALHHGEPA
jgi:hypothetical protein